MDFFFAHTHGWKWAVFIFKTAWFWWVSLSCFSPPEKKQHRKRSRQKKQPPFFSCKKLGFLLRNHWINVGKRYLAQRHKGTKLSDVFGPCPGFFWKCLRVGTDPKNFRTKSKHQHGFFFWLYFFKPPRSLWGWKPYHFFPRGCDFVSSKL